MSRKVYSHKKGYKRPPLSEETRQKISLSQRGRKHFEEQNKKYSESRKGHVVTKETRQKLSIAFTGTHHSQETKEKLRKINLGKHLSEETKRKLSISKKGVKKSDEHRKNISLANLGKHLSEETRKKISLSHLREKAPNWKGGITPLNESIRKSIESRLWREAVFARDNWTCKKCYKRDGKEIHPHHIQNFAQYPELRFAIDNGITFCCPCHYNFHKQYGFKNNTKEQLQEFLFSSITPKGENGKREGFHA